VDRSSDRRSLSNDASNIPDLDWIAEGSRRGWALLTKDQQIRYRAHELEALNGQLFCLSSGNLEFHEMARRFLQAGPAIHRCIDRGHTGFWLVHEGGRLQLKWP
jgi:hypothetical protein